MARGQALRFGSVVAPDRRGFADWVRSLVGLSGCYVIRDKRSGSILYVGESHKNGRLYDTLARHFQSWSGERHGPTYDRGRVEVAIVVTRTGAEALELEQELIEQLDPRDNVRYVVGDAYEGGADEEPSPDGVPF